MRGEGRNLNHDTLQGTQPLDLCMEKEKRFVPKPRLGEASGRDIKSPGFIHGDSPSPRIPRPSPLLKALIVVAVIW